MAYTINFRNQAVLGTGLVMLVGDYSSVNGDTTTLNLPGGYPIVAIFTDANNNIVTTQTLTAKATSGAVTSYTLTSTGTVTNGNFSILAGGK